MVQPGRDSPGKEVKDTSPSPSPKWVFRPTNAKRNMKKSATPHPIKNGGNTKRSACVPLTETGRVRKKIVFEFDELIAGTNGGGSAIAGKDGWSSLPGEREKGRWKRKARPGPFEASTGAFEVVPGVLPLLAGELRFSMGKKDGSARHQPEVVTGTRLDGALPEVNEAVAQGVLRSTRVEAAASAAVLDEDTSSERNGANMLFDPPTLAAPFPEKDRHVLASETCDSLMGQSILQFKSGDGTNFKAEDNNGGGEAGLNGTPSAPDNPSDPPDELLDQDRDQPEILPKHSASEVGIDVASPVGSPPTLGHSLEFITDKAAQAETQPVEPDLDEKPANTGAGLDSGGPPKSDAVNLDADHDTEMGTFGWCEGIPSLTFSNEETKCLVDKVGHAIIGKFSHTLPTPQQIQKSLSNINFVDGFKWKFVNAKHILIQFRDVRDYGRMLNGPNGAPVWFVEHHPMRVFKWTPEFDTFFETPIAAVWCKVVGLPIHLYDQVALIAIGKLLGKPIQVDHATFNQTRLTFARMCIEIDISTPPPVEIILNILGKDTRYKVVWDRIPLFCAECKHVGHVKETCLILGRRKEQATTDPTRPPQPRRPHSASNPIRREWRLKTNVHGTHNPEPGQGSMPKGETEPGTHKEKSGAEAAPSLKATPRVQAQIDDDGFQVVSRKKKGKVHEGDGYIRALHNDKLHLKENVATVTFRADDSGANEPGIGSMSVSCGFLSREMEGFIEDLDPGGVVPCGGTPIAGLN